MPEILPVSPEERRKQYAQGVRKAADRHLAKLGPGTRVYEVSRRVVVGVFKDGFIHAGNIAYLTLITLFPVFIVIAALASLLRRSADTMQAVAAFLLTLPPSVQSVVKQPILDVLTARSGGSLLWLGGLVGLWTVGSFIETIRDILRRAYGTQGTNPFWQYRLFSIGLIVASVFLVLIAFSAQVVLTAAEQFIYRLMPFAQDALSVIGISKLVPLFVLFGALYLLIWTLTPSRYRYSKYPKWPGALFTALWWQLIIYSLPYLLGGLGHYDLTYGSLASVIISLIFFWFVGLGLVVGVHLNAALAEPADKALKGDADVEPEAQ